MSDNPPALAFPRALANLYEDPEWSQKDLAGPIESLKMQVTKSKLGVLAPSQLWRYQQELAERARLGHPPCFTNLWALINEALLHDEVWGGARPGGRSGAVAGGWGQPKAGQGPEVGSGPGPQGLGKAPGSPGFRLTLPSLSLTTTNSQTSGRP